MGDFSVSGGMNQNSGNGQIDTTAQPAPAPLANDTIPQGLNPTHYLKDNDGNWHAAGGVDTATVAVPFVGDPVGSGPLAPYGTFTWLRRLFVRDTGAATQQGKNALVSINHQSGSQTSANNQDRALWVQHYTPVNDATPRYGIETIQAELGIRGAPTWTGSPDAEATCASFQLTDMHTNSTSSPTNLGVNVIRASYFRQPLAKHYGGATTPSACVRALMGNGSDEAGTGGINACFLAVPSNTSTLATNFGFVGYQAQNWNAGGFRYPSFNYGLLIADYGTNTADYNIVSQGTTNSGRNWFQGRVICNRDVRTGNAGNTDFAGQLTLTNGTASYTFTESYTSAPIVTVGNTTSTNGVRVQVTNTGFTLTCTAGDVINYICIGRN